MGLPEVSLGWRYCDEKHEMFHVKHSRIQEYIAITCLRIPSAQLRECSSMARGFMLGKSKRDFGSRLDLPSLRVYLALGDSSRFHWCQANSAGGSLPYAYYTPRGEKRYARACFRSMPSPREVAMKTADVSYLVFDIESVADGDLVSAIRYPGENLTPEEAVERYRAELLAKYESDFIPYTFQVPVSVAVGKVAADFSLLDVVTLDEPEYNPHRITEMFWRGWEAYRRPTLVSFNGRTFDLPLLELAAFRYGISAPGWFGGVKSYEQPRNRYNDQAHLDLYDVLTNYGASRFNGGLNLAATLLGKPGKMEVQGYMVQDLFNEGKLAEINDYCRCDVLDTYFVFLRSRVMVGQLNLEREQEIIARTKDWLIERASAEGTSGGQRAYASYLDKWGDWENPWNAAVHVSEETSDGSHVESAE